MSTFFKARILSVSLFLILLFVSSASAQERYRVGDVVENFTLVDRATGQNVSLYDFEGKIVFLEWFAYWCPFCQAAAEDVEKGIVQYYRNSGNMNGIPVIHVGLNLQADAETLTQSFIEKYSMQQVLNDFDRKVANRFQASNQPIFAIINGVDGSPSHEQWELLYTRLGYGDLDQPIDTFRAAIDSVLAPSASSAPEITQDPLSLRVATGSQIALSVQTNGSDLSYAWEKDGVILESQTTENLIIAQAQLSDAGSYSVSVSNSGGSIKSASAQVSVSYSLSDYLLISGLSGEDAFIGSDPDKDGFSNVFEYLGQSDPDDPLSRPSFSFSISSTKDGPLFDVSFVPHPDSIGYSAVLETSPLPDFSEGVEKWQFSASGDLQELFPTGDAHSIFARIAVSEN